MISLLPIVLAVLLAGPVLSPDPCAATYRLSLIIGTNEGLSSERDLRHAENDAERLHSTLQRLGDFASFRQKLLLKADARQVEEALIEFRGQVAELKNQGHRTLCLFFYSGHGGRQGLHLRGGKLASDRLLQLLRDIRSDLTVAVIDACYSGALVSAKGITVLPPVKVREELAAEGFVLLTSSGEGQVSLESPELKASLFSHHLLTGLSGMADADLDGRVTLTELLGHAPLIADPSLPSQTPAFSLDLEGRGDIVITRLDKAGGLLSITPAGGGRIAVHSFAENREVAGFFPRGPRQSLNLPRGRYAVVQEEGRRRRTVEADLAFRSSAAADLRRVPALDPRRFRQKGGNPYHTSRFEAAGGQGFRPLYPKRLAAMTRLSLSLLPGEWALALALARGASSWASPEAEILRTVYGLGLEASRQPLVFRFAGLGYFAGGGILSVRQEIRRLREEELRALGYGAVPVRWSAIPYAGLGSEARFPLGSRFQASFRLGGEAQLLPGKPRTVFAGPLLEIGIGAGF